jgi:hypothetical protein
MLAYLFNSKYDIDNGQSNSLWKGAYHMKFSFRAFIFCIILLALLIPTNRILAAGGGWNILGQHTVKTGETLYCIGRAYGVDPYAIATQNSIQYAHLIHPGIVLDIPDAAKNIVPGPVCTPQFDSPLDPPPPPDTCGQCSCSYSYKILYGNTLTQISALYDVDMWSIAECNCIFNLNYIRAGDTLCIP